MIPAALVAAMQARAAALDEREAFPAEDIADLAQCGALAAPLTGAGDLLDVLTALGRGNPAVGRLFEAHVNALRLILRDGTPDQVAAATADVAAGHLFGLWVTDLPNQALAFADGRLRGRKGPCSGAGHIQRAVVTLAHQGATRLAIVALDGSEQVNPLRGLLPGMRAAVNGTIAFDRPLDPAALLGGPGAYLQEPDFSCGAWRTTAVTLGALQALTEAAGTQLRQKGHDTAPMQQARFGELLIAQETARLWTAAAADHAECSTAPTADRVAYVNLARLAVEQATLAAITLVQRSLGFGAFIRPNPVERLCRDLSVYLRQPAPDAVLLEAAQHGFSRVPALGPAAP